MSSAYILAGCRTPIGKFQGGFASLPAPELGAIAVREALRRAGIPAADVDHLTIEASGQKLALEKLPAEKDAKPSDPAKWKVLKVFVGEKGLDLNRPKSEE